jgi:hypothetical protein
MSIKRQRQYSTGSRSGDSPEPKKKASKDKTPLPSWDELVQSQPDASFIPYAMATKFEKGAFITHPSFGKGMVLAVEGTRIEVLFEGAVKKLVHGVSPRAPEPEFPEEPADEFEPEPPPAPGPAHASKRLTESESVAPPEPEPAPAPPPEPVHEHEPVPVPVQETAPASPPEPSPEPAPDPQPDPESR